MSQFCLHWEIGRKSLWLSCSITFPNCFEHIFLKMSSPLSHTPNDLYCALMTTTGVREYTTSLEGTQEGFKSGISVTILCAFIGILMGMNKSLWFYIEALFGLFRKIMFYERATFVLLNWIRKHPWIRKHKKIVACTNSYWEKQPQNCSGKPPEVKLGPREREWWEVWREFWHSLFM